MKIVSVLKLVIGLVLFLSTFTSCDDDMQERIGRDVFRPKIISEIVEGNVIKLYWYEVLEGISYTIQLSNDESFIDILDEVTTDELSYTTPKLPYDMTFYIRLRTNADKEENNSIWRVVTLNTEPREIYPILREVNSVDLQENSVILRWEVFEEYPADYLCIEALDMDENGNKLEPIEIQLSGEQFQKGEYNVEGLQPSINYRATIYNNQKEDVYERSYNSITFKTAGPPKGAKIVTSADDLNALLLSDKDNADVQSDQIYYIRGGGSFDIVGFEFTKGFQIVGAPGKETKINVTSAFSPVASAGKIIFKNIHLTGSECLITNQKNDGKDYEWNGLELKDCNITGFNDGFVLLQTSDGNMKNIEGIFIDNCIFNEMQGGYFFATDNFSDQSVQMIEIDKVVISNTTFMNSPQMLLLFLPDAYGYSGSNIHLTMTNVTVFEALSRNKTRMIQMNRLPKTTSTVTISKCLFSNEANAHDATYMFYETCLCGSATTSYSDNYMTGNREETGRKGVGAKSLKITQEQLFEDYETGNLNVKDITSVVQLDKIGDSRWLK